ncbi:MAG: peptidoglycan D,D-transpeptidase FtsI family protein [Candidatus Acetothermia bacterium]
MINKNRLWFITVLFVAGIGLVVWRLVTVQILERETWKERAEAVHKQKVTVQPERGRIYDRDGNPLAINRAAYAVAVDSYNMTQPELLIQILSDELNIPRDEIESLVYRQSSFTWVDRRVDYETGNRIKQRVENAGIEGLVLLDSSRRAYPQKELVGSIVGFTGVEGEGLSGVEHSLNDALEGEPEVKRLTYGANRFPYRQQTLVEGRPGYDVQLTLDLKIQHTLKQELKEGVDRFEAKRAWGVVMDPQTGAVLGMTQDSGFDPNNYGDYDPEKRKNVPVTNSFEPGSIMKVFSGLAALDYDVVEPDTTVNGDTPLVLHGHPINNAQYRDYGTVPFTEVIKHSINTGTIRVAQELGEKRLYDFLSDAGFGQKTGIELSSEQSGQLEHFSQWSGLSIGSIPIGQGMSVTSIQLASKMAAIANGGSLVEPTLVEEIKGPEGETIEELGDSGTSRGLIADTNSVEEMNEMLRQVVVDGTAQEAAIPGYNVAGKTGTAQKAAGGSYLSDTYISSFAGFFPENDPKYLILIVIDEVGTTPVWGGATAGRVFKEVGTRLIKSGGS